MTDSHLHSPALDFPQVIQSGRILVAIYPSHPQGHYGLLATDAAPQGALAAIQTLLTR